MMVAVTINTDGEVHATELGQPVAAFGDPTKKYVQLICVREEALTTSSSWIREHAQNAWHVSRELVH